MNLVGSSAVSANDMHDIHGISVIIPVFNGSQFLRAALDSVRGQSRAADEVIVVDDCSSDDSLQVVEDWRSEHRDMGTLRQLTTKQNSGSPAKPLNLGIAEAKYELIAILEQDDVYEAEKLHACARAFERHPSIDFVTHGGSPLGQPRRCASVAQGNFERDPFFRELLKEDRNCGCLLDSDTATRAAFTHSMYPSGFPGLMFTKRAWEGAGGLPEHYKVATDYAFLVALSKQGSSCYLPQRLYHRRSHARNLSHHSSLSFLETLQSLLGVVRDDPKVLQAAGARGGLIWRTIEAAWNIAAFGYRRQANCIIAKAIEVGGWSLKRELQKHAVWLMPTYRYLKLPNAISSAETADAMVVTAERLLEFCKA